MALIVEDGTGVANANSYVSVAEIKSYAALRGLSLPTPDAAIEPFAIQAFDYLEAQRARYQGSKTSPSQRTQFPRVGVIADGYEVLSNEIPWQLKEAQCQATADGYETELMPNSSPAVKKEKVDVLEVEYQDSPGGQVTLNFPKIDSLLAPLLTASGGGWGVRTVRG